MSFVCEQMRRDALLYDHALRGAVVRWLEASVDYLERHRAALGDAREPLRCYVCNVVRELTLRLDVAARAAVDVPPQQVAPLCAARAP